MKIREVACDRFAGLRLKDPLSFQDGINVVYGKNESGKSTLVNLISQLLFQNVNFGRGGAKKDFEQQFFPVGTASVGDSADGRITLETEDDRYELRKVWGAGSMCSLDTSDVTKRDPDGINEELRKILTYGKGVYSEMLLSSQKNTDLPCPAGRVVSRASGPPAGAAPIQAGLTVPAVTSGAKQKCKIFLIL